MTGAVVAFRGRTDDGPASLTRVRGAWELVSPARREQVGTAEVIRLVGAGEFFPRTVDIVPDLGELLYKEAIIRLKCRLRR